MQKLKQHQPKCDGAVKYMYPGGVYKNKLSIFEELEQIGVRVNEKDKCESGMLATTLRLIKGTLM